MVRTFLIFERSNGSAPSRPRLPRLGRELPFDVGVYRIRDAPALPTKRIAVLMQNLLNIKQAAFPSTRRCSFPIFFDGPFGEQNAVGVGRSYQPAQSVEARVNTHRHLPSVASNRFCAN